MTILVFRDENEIPFCYPHVSRRDRDFRKSFRVVEREKMKLTLVENSRDREFSLTSALHIVWALYYIHIVVEVTMSTIFKIPILKQFSFEVEIDQGHQELSRVISH